MPPGGMGCRVAPIPHGGRTPSFRFSAPSSRVASCTSSVGSGLVGVSVVGATLSGATSAERLRALIAQSRLVVNRRRVAVTVSIGATLVEPEDTAASVLSRADTLLYTAKRTGRNRVCLD